MSDSKQLKMSSPWVEYSQKVRALFRGDPDVAVGFSEDTNTLSIKVIGHKKAEAIGALLPESMEFGNVTLTINVTEDSSIFENKADLIAAAFEGNPALVKIEKDEKFGTGITYISFANSVVQYYADNLQDPNGNKYTLYQELAKEIFGQDAGIFYSTDPKHVAYSGYGYGDTYVDRNGVVRPRVVKR